MNNCSMILIFRKLSFMQHCDVRYPPLKWLLSRDLTHLREWEFSSWGMSRCWGSEAGGCWSVGRTAGLAGGRWELRSGRWRPTDHVGQYSKDLDFCCQWVWAWSVSGAWTEKCCLLLEVPIACCPLLPASWSLSRNSAWASLPWGSPWHPLSYLYLKAALFVLSPPPRWRS